MKFYSEVTKKLYDSEKDLISAEAEVKAAEAKRIEAEKIKKAARANRAKEVETALKEANEAQAKALKLLKDFTNDYGYFHMSYPADTVNKVEENITGDFFDILNSFLQ